MPPRAFRGPARQHVAGDLLRDRRGALNAPALHDIEPNSQHRARQALIVDAGVFEEARVLNRDERVLHVIGNLFDRHEHALLARELRHQRAVAGVDAARHRRLVLLQIGEARQTLQRCDQEDDHRKHARARGNAETDQNLAPRNSPPPPPPSGIAIIAIVVIVVVSSSSSQPRSYELVSRHCAPLLRAC